jgi:integrase
MPFRKNVKNHNSATDMAKNLTSGLPAGTRVSISLEPSGPPDPFGDQLLGGILAGHATLILETSPAEEAQGEDHLLTSQVMESKFKELAHANAKPSTVKTYTNCWGRFAEVFEELPLDRDTIMAYLARFDGASGRYRLNNQDNIHLLYKHALERGWTSRDPMNGMKRPNVKLQQPRSLDLVQVKKLMALEHTPRELAVLHLLVGHGWRQHELLEIKARDVRSMERGWIWCYGKEREEFAPILPETAALLLSLIDDLEDDEQVIGSVRGRHERFGSGGLRVMVKRLLAQAGLTGFTGHNMRDTFATLVERKAGDLTVSMALIRDKVPGVASRYVTRDLPSLLENHSPLRQIGGEHSPVLAERRVPGPENKKRGAPGSIEPGNAFLSASGGDGGELNSPSRRDHRSDVLQAYSAVYSSPY